MDPRRFLSLAALSLTLGGCALLRPAGPDIAPPIATPVAVAAPAPSNVPPPEVEESPTARPYLDVVGTPPTERPASRSEVRPAEAEPEPAPAPTDWRRRPGLRLARGPGL